MHSTGKPVPIAYKTWVQNLGVCGAYETARSTQAKLAVDLKNAYDKRGAMIQAIRFVKQ